MPEIIRIRCPFKHLFPVLANGCRPALFIIKHHRAFIQLLHCFQISLLRLNLFEHPCVQLLMPEFPACFFPAAVAGIAAPVWNKIVLFHPPCQVICIFDAAKVI